MIGESRIALRTGGFEDAEQIARLATQLGYPSTLEQIRARMERIMAEKLGRVGAELGGRQNKLLTHFGLPTVPLTSWPTDQLIDVMRRDKKAVAGRMRFILPSRIGEVQLIDDIAESLVRDVLEGR